MIDNIIIDKVIIDNIIMNIKNMECLTIKKEVSNDKLS